MHFSTRLVDATTGRGAAGVPVRLDRHDHDGWRGIAVSATGTDGNVDEWVFVDQPLVERGIHRLTYDTNAYFAGLGVVPFHPEVSVAFLVCDPTERYDVMVLIAPSAYMTFRNDR